MNKGLLAGSLALYFLALIVTVLTRPEARTFWPLYLPLFAAAAIFWTSRRV